MNRSNLGIKIGSVIRKNRKKHNISQEELGNTISVSKSTISRYEKGIIDMPVSKLTGISEYCGFPMRDYISEEETEKILSRVIFTKNSRAEQPEEKEIKTYLYKLSNSANLERICTYCDIYIKMESMGKHEICNEIKEICIEEIQNSIPEEMHKRVMRYFEMLKSLSD